MKRLLPTLMIAVLFLSSCTTNKNEESELNNSVQIGKETVIEEPIIIEGSEEELMSDSKSALPTIDEDFNPYNVISDYLWEEAVTTYSPYYEVLETKITNYQENVLDDMVEAIFIFTVVHKNFDIDPDTVGYIKEAKENNNPSYQTLYNEYLEPKDMNMELKAVLDKTGEISLFTDINPHNERDWVAFNMSETILSE